MDVPRFAGIRRLALGLLAASSAWLSLGGTSHATDYPVSSLLDTGAGSLRAAVASANANAGPDSVSFGATTGTIELTSGQIAITGPVEIVGPSPLTLAVDANESSRIFAINNIPDPGVEISGLRFTGGQPVDGCSCGGAIQNFNTHLLISGSNFDHNDATWGGAIESFQAELEVENSTFSANTSSDEIGGGAIHVGEGEATVTSSSFFENHAANIGGAIQAGGAKLTLRDSTIVNNSTDQYDGGISNDDGKAKIINSTITGNTTAKYGGGIGNSGRLVVKTSTIAGNLAKFGGGIGSDGKPKLSSTIVADNTAIRACPEIASEGTVKSNFSLIEKKQCVRVKGRKNILGKDPKLGALGDHGGLTDTIDLLAASRAIDKGAKSAPR